MVDVLYIEENLMQHPRVQAIQTRFPKAQTVICEHYSEVFNRKAQNFRLQKHLPALILAEKKGKYVLDAPSGYGIGAQKNYYFSHMLNCPYDCRYCFLQGMYRSANYVLFVNYEDFLENIAATIALNPGEKCHFFSGYDGDSLAYEPVSGFLDVFLPFFRDSIRQNPHVLLELRTKSTQVRSLLAMPDPVPNCIVAFSFTPEEVSSLEKGVPSMEKRLAVMQRLQRAGWTLGLRFDPLIYHDGYRQSYQRLFSRIFETIDADKVHSVSMGGFRLPEAFFQKMWKLYPDEAFFAGPLALNQDSKMVGYKQALEQAMVDYCETELLKYIKREQYFPCTV